ncbi:hypothetical protein KAU32_05155 [bacterium]|nr:hypothetical protein [bacterium]
MKHVVKVLIITVVILVILVIASQILPELHSPAKDSYYNTITSYRNFVIEIAKYEVENNSKWCDSELNFFLRVIEGNREEDKVETDVRFFNRKLIGSVSIKTNSFNRRDTLCFPLKNFKQDYTKLKQWEDVSKERKKGN